MATTRSRPIQHARRVRRGSAGSTSARAGSDREVVWNNTGLDERQPIGVRHVGMSNWGPNDEYERLPWKQFSLQLVVEGSGLAELNGEQHLLVPGDMLLVKPNDYCHYYTGPTRRWKKVYMAIRPAGALDIIARLGLDRISHIRLARPGFQRARQRFSALIDAVRAKPRGFSERVSVLGYNLLLIAAQAAPVLKELDCYPVQVKRAMLHAESHCNRHLTVADLARVARCSRQHLSTMFSAYLGMGVHEWLTRVRINRARSLLGTIANSIAFIAHASGYEDPFHFSRAFKHFTGVTPSQYRKQVTARSAGTRQISMKI